jgi:nucleoside-diphosphate-sugar epimerase
MHVAEALANSSHRIVITGAGGWLGMATLELLHNALGKEFQSRVLCYGSSARPLILRGGVTIPQQPLAEMMVLDNRPTILLHLAFLTKDRAEAMDEIAYQTQNRALSDFVLNALDTVGTTALFVASSGAARHSEDESAAPALRLYGALKKRDEDSFAIWAQERHRTAVITRIFNVAGPYINKHQNYALAAFILDALAKRPIVVHAPHRVVRSYVGIRELMSLVFAILIEDGGEVSRFDTAGTALELAEVAHEVAAELGGASVERATIIGDRIDHYVGEGGRYDRLLRKYGIKRLPLDQQIRDTADFLIAAQ